MATSSPKPSDLAIEIGETAGKVWNHLNTEGECSIAQLTKALDAPRDITLLAVGWLAREEKLLFLEKGRTKIVTLKS